MSRTANDSRFVTDSTNTGLPHTGVIIIAPVVMILACLAAYVVTLSAVQTGDSSLMIALYALSMFAPSGVMYALTRRIGRAGRSMPLFIYCSIGFILLLGQGIIQLIMLAGQI